MTGDIKSERESFRLIKMKILKLKKLLKKNINLTCFLSLLTEVKVKQQLEKISHMVKRFHKELKDVKPTPECKTQSFNESSF